MISRYFFQPKRVRINKDNFSTKAGKNHKKSTPSSIPQRLVSKIQHLRKENSIAVLP